MPTPELLYHYTDAAGLLGILGSWSQWATDARFLNDATELAYAREELLPALYARGEADIYGSGLVGVVIENIETEPFGVYVSCFCEDGDLLSQWRGYGAEQGYALGVDLRAFPLASEVRLDLMPSEDLIQLAQVTYGLEQARERLREMVEALASDLSGHVGVHGYFATRMVLALVASVKHAAFAEEREWRLIQVGYGYGSGYPDSGNIKFRASKLGVLPYRVLPLPTGTLRRIVVGPGGSQDARAEGVRLLLRQRDIEAEVVPSHAPYRS